MPEVDVADETWLAITPHRLAPTVALPSNWRRWWPEFTLEVDELRGEQGVRWFVHGDDLHGSMEIYLQPLDDGTLAHFYLRVDGRRVLRRRDRDRFVRHYRRRAKTIFWAISDRLDPGRLDRVDRPASAIP